VTGRLQAGIGGRLVDIEARGDHIVLDTRNLLTAWRVRSCVPTLLVPILKSIRSSGLRLMLQTGARWEFEILPQPAFVLRLFCPPLRQLEN